jgi:hypothetical protein
MSINQAFPRGGFRWSVANLGNRKTGSSPTIFSNLQKLSIKSDEFYPSPLIFLKISKLVPLWGKGYWSGLWSQMLLKEMLCILMNIVKRCVVAFDNYVIVLLTINVMKSHSKNFKHHYLIIRTRKFIKQAL